MADLPNPVVSSSYRCGCTLTDDTEIGGRLRWRFGGDETAVFRAKLELQAAKTAGARRGVLDRALARIGGGTRKPSRASLESLTPDEVYGRLVERAADEVTHSTSDEGVRLPVMPATCPRHGEPALHTHASYLNPADAPPADLGDGP